jgi:hypothetical protein
MIRGSRRRYFDFQKSKTNPAATARSVFRRSIGDSVISGFSALVVLLLKGTLTEHWGWVIVFAILGAFVGAIWAWQDGDQPD